MTLDQLMRIILWIFPDALVNEVDGEVVISTGLAVPEGGGAVRKIEPA